MNTCCEVQPSVPNLAIHLKDAAVREVKRKGITFDLYFLTHCANPYPISNGGIVISHKKHLLDVYVCGKLVFRQSHGMLIKYICGDWSDIIAQEVKTIQVQRASIRIQDQTQRFRNKAARMNYVVC